MSQWDSNQCQLEYPALKSGSSQDGVIKSSFLIKNINYRRSFETTALVESAAVYKWERKKIKLFLPTS